MKEGRDSVISRVNFHLQPIMVVVVGLLFTVCGKVYVYEG